LAQETENTGGARAFYSEQKSEEVSPLQPLELWAPCKARWVWAGKVAIFFEPRAH
jgi:hypothetical protein